MVWFVSCQDMMWALFCFSLKFAIDTQQAQRKQELTMLLEYKYSEASTVTQQCVCTYTYLNTYYLGM